MVYLKAMFQKRNRILQSHHFFLKDSDNAPMDVIECIYDELLGIACETSERGGSCLSRMVAADIVESIWYLYELHVHVWPTARTDDLKRAHCQPSCLKGIWV